jgi:hypothetical protein
MELMLKSDIFTFTKLSDSDFLTCKNALKPVRVPIEQSTAWGDFNQDIQGREYLGTFRYDDADGKLIALATAILYREKGRDWIWIKHGPLFAAVPTTEVIAKLCATLKKQFGSIHSTKPVFIRLSMPSKVGALTLPFEHTMYDQTIVIDLEKPEDTLFAEFSQSGRQGVRKALKASVTVQEVTKNVSDFFAEKCYPILEETGSRDKFGIHPLTTYTTMLSSLEAATLFVAGVNEDIQAWAIITEYDGQALYYYGASNATARETHAAYALQWEIIKTLKNRDVVAYDLMGIAGKHYPSLANVTKFKTKFSKNIVEMPLTYDLPIQSAKYRALSLAIKAKRKLQK